MPVSGPAYPVNLLLTGRRVLVVGGGTVAVEKIQGLLAAEAVVHVVATVVSEAVRDLAVTWEERPYRRDEVVGYRLAVACTDDPAANQAVFDDGESAGIWVNAADDPERCAYTLPARLDQGRLLVTVSTAGHSPALASWLRDQLAGQLGPEYDILIDLLAEGRARLVAQGRPTLGADWRSALDSGMLDLVRAGRIDEAREQLHSALAPAEPSPSVFHP